MSPKDAQLLTTIDVACLLVVRQMAGDDAFAGSIHAGVCDALQRDVSVAAVYAALDRLGRDGLVTSTQTPPRQTRGGRSRRLFELTDAGRDALSAERAVHERLWNLSTPGTRS